MRTEEIGMRAPNKTMWWKVDLGGLRNIYNIDILFWRNEKATKTTHSSPSCYKCDSYCYYRQITGKCSNYTLYLTRIIIIINNLITPYVNMMNTNVEKLSWQWAIGAELKNPPLFSKLSTEFSLNIFAYKTIS